MRLVTVSSLILALGLLNGCGNGTERALKDQGYDVEDLRLGEGREAAPGDQLTVSYSIWIYDAGTRGMEMEAVGDEGRSFVLGAGQVMPGWDAGLVGMREGGVRKLVLAPEMIGRGFRPRGVAADEMLWCEISLRAIARVQTIDLTVGEGEAVQQGDYVRIRYSGWHQEDGARGERFAGSDDDTATVGLMLGAGMINAGLEIGLEGMRVGGRREVIVPPALAYGKRGREPVKPDATLVYEVELVDSPEVVHEILTEGEGEPVAPGYRVRFHLAGWVRQPDGSKGEKFQESRDLSNPYTAVLGEFKLQPGLELGIQGMKAGELRRLQVPAAMAFGPRGWHRGDRTLVPPNTDVIYEVELLPGPVQVK
jgi:FKBP-type peptidyl-prolyl cis-trans isomerase